MPKVNIPTPVLISVLAAFLGGGLAGAVFNYFVNRPQPSVLMYTVTTTTIATAQSAPFIPNLRVEVGNENVKSLFVHTIEVTAASGPFVQQADIAIMFPNKPHIFGTDTGSPSPVHSISCTDVDSLLRCRLSPISTEMPKPYKISIATDTNDPPKPLMAVNNVQFLSASELAAANGGVLAALRKPELWALIGGSITYFALAFYGIRALRRRWMPQRLVVLGKVTGPDGAPIPDALVEVAVEAPRSSRRSARTDAMGDFITGNLGLRKEPLFAAHVKITHPGFPLAEFNTNSAIIAYTFPPTENVK